MKALTVVSSIPKATTEDVRLSIVPTRTTLHRLLRLAYWSVPTLIIGLIPAVLWTGVRGGLMNLGGDDSHLMYAYPAQWLTHMSLSPLGQNLSGYNSGLFFLPFTSLLWVIKAAGFNSQGIAFGLALALTYAGIVRLTLELIGNNGAQARAAACVAGAIATCAPLMAETQWTALLTGIFWEPLLPWLFLLFLWHQRTGKAKYSLIAAVAVAMGAPAINQFAWTIPCALLFVCLAVVASLGGLIKPRIDRLAILCLSVVALNAFWIIPIAIAPLLHQAQFAAAMSVGGRSEGAAIVRAIAPLMSAQDIVGLRNSAQLMQAFSWSALVPDRWSQSLWFLGMVPFLLIIGGVTATVLEGGRSVRRRTVLGVASLALVFLYFESVQLGPFGVGLFQWLVQTIPGWTAERNFFDKFACAYIEIFAITAGVCLYQITKQAPARLVAGVAVLLSLAMVIYDGPFLTGSEFRLPYHLGVSYSRVMPGLPADYLAMLDRIKQLPPGAVVSLPLSGPAWSVVPSAHGDGVYIGISPITFLTGRPDYNGIDSFASPVTSLVTSVVRDDVNHGNILSLARLAGDLGVKYVVLYTGASFDHQYYQVAAVGDPVLEAHETASFVSEVAPKLLGRFGRFELHELSPAYSKPVASMETSSLLGGTAYLEEVSLDLPRRSPAEMCYFARGTGMRRAEDHYSIDALSVGPDCSLVLREAFSTDWRATIALHGKAYSVGSEEAYGFANSFVLPAAPGEWQHIDIIYGPSKIRLTGFLVSLFSLLVLAIYSAMRLLKRMAKRISQEGDPDAA